MLFHVYLIFCPLQLKEWIFSFSAWDLSKTWALISLIYLFILTVSCRQISSKNDVARDSVVALQYFTYSNDKLEKQNGYTTDDDNQ